MPDSVPVSEGYVRRFEVRSGWVDRTFCTDGSSIETEVADRALGEFGFATPEEVVAADAESRRVAASNPEIPAELRAMLEPTRNLSYQRSTDDPPPGIAYFDIPATNGFGLLARVTVSEFPGDGWNYASSVHCSSVFVTDLDAYQAKQRELYPELVEMVERNHAASLQREQDRLANEANEANEGVDPDRQD